VEKIKTRIVDGPVHVKEECWCM